MTVINTNNNALFAQNSIAQVSKSQSAAMQQLSTGSRINSAKDDAAGLAIATRMTSDINGYGVAVQNSNQGMNMAQTADNAINNVNSILQTMRQLAVEASNGTMTASNRAATQAEYKQLSNQIDSIAQTTTSNGIQLLNGSAGNIVLQTGVNQGNTMTMSIGSVQTKDIGIGSLASLTSVQTSVTATNVPTAMTAGDLLINGVQVGPSLASSDSSSYALASASSISKAAAINLVSSLSGVTATVDPTVVQGSAMTSTAANTDAGTLTINGVTTASVTVGADTTINRQNFVTAINEISKQTGVTAIDTGNATHGIQLVAADGRNITAMMNGTLTASDTGLNTSTGSAAGGTTAVTFSGQIELHSTTNSAINLSTTATGNIANAGFAVGTFQPNVAQVTTNARSVVAGAATVGAGVQTFDGGTLSLNGVTIGAALATSDTSSDTTANSSLKQNSAIAIAAAINHSTSLTGVSATAAATTVVGSTYTAGSLTTGFMINGVTISAVAQLSVAPSKTAVVNAINQYSGQTGVVASDNGYGITYTAQDGRNISMWAGTGTAATSLGLGGTASSAVGISAAAGDYATKAATTYAQVQLQSNSKFTVASGNDGNNNSATVGASNDGFTALGFQSGTFGGANNGLKISQVNLSTQSGAQSAITAIDAAIATVSAIQSNVGAYQNRLSSTVTNLQTMSTNMTNSRSTIQDTNYNTATTALARSQIISQAATAMLAQANQSGQTVLSLLK